MSSKDKIKYIGCLKTICIYIIIFVIIIVSYGLYGYFSVEPLPKEELIKRGIEFFDRNKKDLNSIVNALHLLKFPIDNRGAEVKISSWTKLPRLHHTGNDSIFRKINESVYDSIVSLIDYHKELCHYGWYDSIGNFSYLSDAKYVNVNREHYWIEYIVNEDDYNYYPHDSIPLEETNWRYQIEGNWYLVSP